MPAYFGRKPAGIEASCRHRHATIAHLDGILRAETRENRIPMPKKKADKLLPKLSEAELDLVSHIEQDYELETDLLGSDPRLRRLKDGEVIRPASATQNTIRALEQRGVIAPAKGREALTLIWRLTKKSK